MNNPTLTTFITYLVVLLIISYFAFRKTQNLSDYLIGGRQLSSGVAALSAGASDMSGWLLLGLPGAIFASGLNEVWIVIGLTIGAYLNWRFVAAPLRQQTEKYNALTLSDYFAARFNDKTQLLRLISAIIILLFFTFYTASGLVAGAKLFANSFGLDYQLALAIGAVVIVLYTAVGGFLAVSWTDVIQGLLMLVALIAVPLIVTSDLGGLDATQAAINTINPGALDPFYQLTAISILSLLAWGLGYFGQPHILTRFMAIKSPDAVPAARRIGMSWMILTLVGAVLVGLTGIGYFATFAESAAAVNNNQETIFIELTQILFNPWIAGILLAAILAAVMSTIDSQLLVSSSALSTDFYQALIRPNASNEELVWFGRAAVLGIALIAIFIASDPNSQVLSLVSYAWGGCGAAFGPVVIMSLFWQKTTRNGALAGMIVGAVTVIVWKQLEGGWFNIFALYELLPGFVFGLLTIYWVSKFTTDNITASSPDILRRTD